MRRWGTRPSGWWLLVGVAVGVSTVSGLSRLLPGVVGGAVVAMAATVGGVLAQRGQQLVEEGTRRAAEVRTKLMLDRRGRVPRVEDVEDLIAIGVHPAAPAGATDVAGARVPPFVRRDRSAEIEEALRTHRFVLIVGESTAGKSRAAFEAARRVLPRAAFVVPDPAEPTALRSAAAALRGERDSVVWLDDVERYLGTGGLTPYLLRELTRTGIVLATIRAQERAQYMDVQPLAREGTDGPRGRTGRDVLAQAYEIRLDRRWREGEVARAREYGQDDRLVRAVGSAGRYGIAEFLAAGPQLLAAWQDAWAPEGRHVRGAALVAAAVEARWAGWHRPLPAALLRELHEQHLAARGGAALRPEGWEEALAWATTPLYATSSLLLPQDSPEESYYVFDYLADATEVDTPVLEGTWGLLIAAADPELCEDIGWAATYRARPSAAEEAFQKAWDNGVRTAAIGLARALGDALRHEDACRLLRTALGSAPADTDPEVLFALRSALAWRTGQAGNTQEALDLATALHDEARRKYGDDHRETLETALGVVRWTGHSGRPQEALDLALAAQERSLRVLGSNDPMTLSWRFEVAVMTQLNGRFAEAVRLWSALVGDAERLLGGVYSDLRHDARWNLSSAVRETGDIPAALDLLSEVVEVRGLIYGHDQAWTFTGRLELAAWTGTAGQHSAALALLSPAVEDMTRALGHDHVLTLAGRHQQALWSAESTASFRELAADCERSLGPDHPLTQDSRARIDDPNKEVWYYLPPSW